MLSTSARRTPWIFIGLLGLFSLLQIPMYSRGPAFPFSFVITEFYWVASLPGQAADQLLSDWFNHGNHLRGERLLIVFVSALFWTFVFLSIGRLRVRRKKREAS